MSKSTARRQRKSAIDEIRGDRALLGKLSEGTPRQLDAYIDAQVTDLASARDLLKKMARVLMALVKSRGV